MCAGANDEVCWDVIGECPGFVENSRPDPLDSPRPPLYHIAVKAQSLPPEEKTMVHEGILARMGRLLAGIANQTTPGGCSQPNTLRPP